VRSCIRSLPSRELPLNLDEVQVRLDLLPLFEDAVRILREPGCEQAKPRSAHHGGRDNDQRQLALQNISLVATAFSPERSFVPNSAVIVDLYLLDGAA